MVLNFQSETALNFCIILMCALYESCKMNDLDFGRNIEEILTRMNDGDKDYLSMLPYYYKAPEIQVENCA